MADVTSSARSGLTPIRRPVRSPPGCSGSPSNSAWAQAELHANNLRLEALDDASRAIAGELDVERVLQLIVDRVRDLIGAKYAALGTVDDQGQITRFIASGITARTATADRSRSPVAVACSA